MISAKDVQVSIVRDALRGVAEVENLRTPGETPTGVTVTTVDGQTHRLETLWAGEGWPSDIRRALAHVAQGEWPRDLVVVARSLSPGALDLLKECDANWADQRGQVRLVVPPGLLVSREHLPAERDTPLPTLNWSESAVQLAEWILNQPTDQPLRTGDLAEATMWSPGRVSTVLQSFDALEWTEAKGAKSGPGAWRRLANPGSMLDSWADHVGRQAHNKRLGHHATRNLLRFTETELRTAFGWDDKQTWALTTWAGLELVAPFVTTVPVVHIYLAAERFSEVSQIISRSGLREVDEGARFEFWEAGFPLHTQLGRPSETPVIATPRLYADLLALGSRGADAAEHLREMELDF